jgi:hypothetical protein
MRTVGGGAIPSLPPSPFLNPLDISASYILKIQTSSFKNEDFVLTAISVFFHKFSTVNEMFKNNKAIINLC